MVANLSDMSDSAPRATTKEQRARQARMIMSLFDLWHLSHHEQASMLGLSPHTRATLNRYRNGAPLADNRDLLDRVSHLFGIHECLHSLFPENPERAYQWMKAPNADFENTSPLHYIEANGFAGLLKVKRYCQFQLMQ